MRAEVERSRSTALIVGAIIVSLLVGAGVTYWIMRSETSDGPRAGDTSDAPSGSMAGTSGTSPSAPVANPSSPGVVVVSLSPEAIERAGIVVTAVTEGAGADAVRIPGIVEPNAYREVVVTPIAAGRVTRVNAQLGDHVRRGQTIAQIYSPQLAEAQTRYLSAQAELEAAVQQLRRTERLVEIGAASRQELDDVRAGHTARATAVEGARSQLVLLGMAPAAIKSLSTASEITATINVPAPIDGVITERTANIGLNVDPATELFTVVDLSTVWIVGHLYEKDFRRVGVGTPAEITTTAYPDLVLRGKVSYIDPEVSPDTRTARVRVEVGNPEGRLRLGMFADMQMDGGSGARVAMVPRTAVQVLGERSVVYVVDDTRPGQFIEREVTLGRSSGENVAVLSGVESGDDVVAQGSFFVRAERERVNPLGSTSAGVAPRSAVPGAEAQPQSPGEATVRVTERGFEPDRVTVPKGEERAVTFIRTTDDTCATEIAIPSLEFKRALPLNQPVRVAIKSDSGEVAFACGMNMLKGTIVVQ